MIRDLCYSTWMRYDMIPMLHITILLAEHTYSAVFSQIFFSFFFSFNIFVSIYLTTFTVVQQEHWCVQYLCAPHFSFFEPLCWLNVYIFFITISFIVLVSITKANSMCFSFVDFIVCLATLGEAIYVSPHSSMCKLRRHAEYIPSFDRVRNDFNDDDHFMDFLVVEK